MALSTKHEIMTKDENDWFFFLAVHEITNLYEVIFRQYFLIEDFLLDMEDAAQI